MTSRLFQIMATTLLASIAFLPNSGSNPRIVPGHVKATFSIKDSQERWSVPIKSTDGNTAYLLSLEPYFDVGSHVVTVELVLRHPGDKADAPNLLDPTGSRHGLQAYDFAADDLAQGVQKSAFGEKRTVALKNLGLVIRIHVLKATVSPMSSGNYQLDELKLQIAVNNSRP